MNAASAPPPTSVAPAEPAAPTAPACASASVESSVPPRSRRRAAWAFNRNPALTIACGSLLVVGGTLAVACGFWLPNRLLTDGGSSVLESPTANFARELALMKLATTPHRAVPSSPDFLSDSADAELAELREALQRSGRPAVETERIVKAHADERAVMNQIVRAAAARTAWPAPPVTNPPPVLAAGMVRVVDGLPGEFADYFQGAMAWHNGATNTAIAHWDRLLSRPAADRRYRSTWASFMIGKATWETNPRRAIAAFQQTRRLATNGFPDRIGLAAASLGWEARAELRRGQFDRAIDLYLEQLEAGDPTALLSLSTAAQMALERNARSLGSLARHPRAQRVITAYLIATGSAEAPVDIDNPVKEAVASLLDKQTWVSPPSNGWHTLEFPALLWLEAVESAGVRDVDSAEKLALAAYQAGEFRRAERWLKLAPNRPAARWLQAKLALRNGQIDAASHLLSQLVHDFPPAPPETPSLRTDETEFRPAAEPPHSTLLQRLRINSRDGGPDPARHLLSEFGAVRLARRDYTTALDALIRGGCLTDAAYVADRVLTLDELKAYVDRSWPESTRRRPQPVPASEPQATPAPTPGAEHEDIGPSQLSNELVTDATSHEPVYASTPRDWLAWRLIRAGQAEAAWPYLPDDGRPVLEVYLQAQRARKDVQRPAAERAEALWAAARTVMDSGLTLFTPPAETDWHNSGGFTFTNPPPDRLTPGSGALVLPMTRDELDRVNRTAATNGGWYYRFVATDLAWEAAVLMPDQNPETAHVLWQAGTWIKYADPKAADRFYKALVRRCGRTPLGREADRKRWFPAQAL